MIACYARVSTQEQAMNGHSIDEQIERMHKYANAMGWTVFKTYVDAGFSGANTNRPNLQNLIKDDFINIFIGQAKLAGNSLSAMKRKVFRVAFKIFVGRAENC